MSSEGLHEPREVLSQHTLDMHRAIVSLMEELEAADWYNQRAEACTDAALREILMHNRNEEIEHASMVLEWLRRNDPVFGEELSERLGQPGPIVAEDHGEEPSGPSAGGAGDGSLGIGSLALSATPTAGDNESEQNEEAE